MVVVELEVADEEEEAMETAGAAAQHRLLRLRRLSRVLLEACCMIRDILPNRARSLFNVVSRITASNLLLQVQMPSMYDSLVGLMAVAEVDLALLLEVVVLGRHDEGDTKNVINSGSTRECQILARLDRKHGIVTSKHVLSSTTRVATDVVGPDVTEHEHEEITLPLLVVARRRLTACLRLTRVGIRRIVTT